LSDKAFKATASKMPTAKGNNGRDDRGRFLPGNPGGPGNPLAARVSKLRSALLNAVTEDDVKEIVRKLVSLAKSGDTVAARILFDRVLGRPIESDLIARIEELEMALEVTP
jgi:hypothetical protein